MDQTHAQVQTVHMALSNGLKLGGQTRDSPASRLQAKEAIDRTLISVRRFQPTLDRVHARARAVRILTGERTLHFRIASTFCIVRHLQKQCDEMAWIIIYTAVILSYTLHSDRQM